MRAQRLHEGDYLGRQHLARVGHLAPDDLEFARRRWIADPVVQAAALDRIVDLARAVRGDDHDRRRGGAHGFPLGNRDLEVRQHLEQIRLERLVGAIEFVDQQHRRPRVRKQCPQQRALDQEALRIQLLRDLVARGAGRFSEADLDQLARDVPLVRGRVDVEALVTLQPDQFGIERRRQHLGDLGLAGARLTLDEQRPLQLQRQKHRGRQLAVGDVVLRGQQFAGGVDRCGWIHAATVADVRGCCQRDGTQRR